MNAMLPFANALTLQATPEEETLTRPAAQRLQAEEETTGTARESTLLPHDLLFHFDVKIYGNGDFSFDQQPSELKPGFAQAGIEFRGPRTWAGESLRLISAIDLQATEESAWSADVSVRTGIQLEDATILNRKMQVLLEYYNGKSPNGHSYPRNIEILGLGLHFFCD